MTDLIQLSSLEKILPQSDCNLESIKQITVLHGEEASYQIAFKENHKTEVNIKIISDIDSFVTVYSVGCVPVMLPTYESALDDPDYISTEPSIYPDILMPVENGKTEANGWYQSIWIKVDKNVPVGLHNITVELTTAEEKKCCELVYEVLPIELPDSDLIFTQWFHTDCISSYYNVPVWSEKHWELIEKFIHTAVKNGINMILTPVFTPPLDTEVGGERPTVQLVKIIKECEKYSFDFSLLERWVKLCIESGVKYFEISHLFTQWGAKYTPKIVATEDGEEKRIFGWDVNADDERYENFLSQFLPALIAFFEKKNLLQNTYFHISDEPSEQHSSDYLKAKNIAVKYLKDCHIIDALSDYNFYKTGIVELPVVAIDSINPFIGNIDELWGYYCCAQCNGVSNRFIAMPSSRNRFIALQMYKYKLKGFLQWGYNFYYKQYSKGMINPFFQNDSGGAFPAGDPFSVYPGENGPVESLRLVVFHHALQDLAAFKLLESLIGYDETLSIIENVAGDVVFDKCTSDSKVVLKTRELINNKLKEILCGSAK